MLGLDISNRIQIGNDQMGRLVLYWGRVNLSTQTWKHLYNCLVP